MSRPRGPSCIPIPLPTVTLFTDHQQCPSAQGHVHSLDTLVNTWHDRMSCYRFSLYLEISPVYRIVLICMYIGDGKMPSTLITRPPCNAAKHLPPAVPYMEMSGVRYPDAKHSSRKPTNWVSLIPAKQIDSRESRLREEILTFFDSGNLEFSLHSM